MKRAELKLALGVVMLADVEYRKFVLKIGPQRKLQAGTKPRFRESLDTLALGALSTSIGVVLLIALAAAIARRPIPGWTERAMIGSSALYYVPSKDCAIAALVGECLGLSGILLAKYHRRVGSSLSTLGTAMCLLHIFLYFVWVLLIELL
jgi:hypothetical protein